MRWNVDSVFNIGELNVAESMLTTDMLAAPYKLVDTDFVQRSWGWGAAAPTCWIRRNYRPPTALCMNHMTQVPDERELHFTRLARPAASRLTDRTARAGHD